MATLFYMTQTQITQTRHFLLKLFYGFMMIFLLNACNDSISHHQIETEVQHTTEFPPAPLAFSDPNQRQIGYNWNLVSFPITKVTSLSTFLNKEAEYGNIQSVWKWDQKLQNWKVYPETGNFSLLTEIAPDEGYWIRSRAEFSLSGSGVSHNLYSFSQGWNLIGISHSAKETAISYFISQHFGNIACGQKEAILSIWVWENHTWQVYFPNDEERLNLNTQYGTNFPALTVLPPGIGAWVNTNRENTPPELGGCSTTTTSIPNTTTTSTVPNTTTTSSTSTTTIPITTTTTTTLLQNSNRLPATGQILSYLTGDDGAYKAGKTMSYTDHGNGTITDNVTGLMWQ